MTAGAKMDDMRIFKTNIFIESAERRGVRRELLNVMVDTGSEYTWIPAEILRELGVRAERDTDFRTADGRKISRPIGFAIVHAAGSSAAETVVFAEAGDMTLLGARSLEGLNLRVDVIRKQLVDAGPIPAAVAA
jgi:predicted aspartyl protease